MDYDELEDEYEAYWNEQTAEQLKTVIPQAWAMAYFGDDCLVIASDDGEYIQIICQKEYPLSNGSVQDIWNSLMAAMVDATVLQNGIEWDRMGIKFLQENGKEFLEFVFKKADVGFEFEGICGDLDNVVFISDALSTLF